MSESSMPPEIPALAAEIRCRLARGELNDRGPVELAYGVTFGDSALAARVVLADVDHCAETGELGRSPPDGERWRTLAEDLHVLRSMSDPRP